MQLVELREFNYCNTLAWSGRTYVPVWFFTFILVLCGVPWRTPNITKRRNLCTLFSQTAEICIATYSDASFVRRGVRVLSAIFLSVRLPRCAVFAAWVVEKWHLDCCVILLMRMSGRSRRVHGHCRALRQRALQIERLLTRSMEPLLSWLDTELLYLPRYRILLEYGILWNVWRENLEYYPTTLML